MLRIQCRWRWWPTINPDEASVIRQIFAHYLDGYSLGKIADELFQQGVPSPTGKPRWNREAIHKLLVNEKYTGRVLLQKTISTGAAQIINRQADQYLYTEHHEAIISDEMFQEVHEERLQRSRSIVLEFAT